MVQICNKVSKNDNIQKRVVAIIIASFSTKKCTKKNHILHFFEKMPITLYFFIFLNTFLNTKRKMSYTKFAGKI